MKISYKLSLFFAVLFSLSACNLDQYSTSTIPIEDPKEVFVTYRDAERFGTGMTAYFRGTTYGDYAAISDVQGDLFNASIDFGNRNGDPHTMSTAFTPSDRGITDIWNGYFNAIKAYNYFLENIHYVLDNPDLTLSASQRDKINQWKGNAFFYRAYTYLELTKKFCQPYDVNTAATVLGLPKVFSYNINLKPKREVLQETIDFIQIDIDSAKKTLTKIPGVLRSTVPTIDAVTALQARLSLWIGDYANAALNAGSLIQSGKYNLAKTKEEMQAMWIYENGPEDILQLYSSLTESPRSIGIYMSYAGLVGLSATESVNSYTPDFFPTNTLFTSFESSDIRREVYFSNEMLQVGGDAVRGNLFAKFRGNPALTSSSHHAGALQAKIFRIAEMYLIKAEAEAIGGVGDATSTLNTLQSARGTTPTAGTLDKVKIEWARETVGEGMRIECLKRWGDGFTNRRPINRKFVVQGAGYTDIIVTGDSHFYTWPIPTDEMAYNPSMKGQQNPGW